MLSRINGVDIGAQRSPTELEKYVIAQFAFLYDICNRHNIAIPMPPLPEVSVEPLSAYAQRRLDIVARRTDREKNKTSKRNKSGWITRRGVERIMASNPGIEKSAALQLYLSEHPRTRTNIPTPETAKTVRQKAWVSRIQNIIDEFRNDGMTLTWVEAHKIAVERFRGARGQSVRETG